MSARAERPVKRLRRLSTDSEGPEEAIDWAATDQHRRSSVHTADSNMARSRRTASGGEAASASVTKEPPSSPSQPPSMRLTVKLPSSKLRDATAPHKASGSRPSISLSSRERLEGGEILEGKRSRNVKKSYVVESGSEDEDMPDVEDDEDAEGESVEDEEDEEEDAEGEDEDAEGDIDMDLHPPPPVIKLSKPSHAAKPVLKAKPAASNARMLPVEEKESVSATRDVSDDDDDELSELEMDSDMEEGDQSNLGGEEDAEGDDEEEVEAEVGLDDDDELGLDSDDEYGMGSRGSTPDLSKLTVRQRAKMEATGSDHLLKLPDEVQTKKHLTAEEHAMRRSEMARRRKNLSEKRNEEEKMETINKLLKKQAPKTNSRRANLNGLTDTGNAESDEPQKPSAISTRWVSSKEGSKMGVPEEWLAGPLGSIFANSVKVAPGFSMGGKMVMEVE